MKYLCTGDWHIRETTPVYRKDNFKEALKRKLAFIKDICDLYQVTYILQPGDFFDDATRVSHEMLTEWIKFFRPFPKILSVLGQHDLKNHSVKNKNIPAYVLQEAGIIDILNPPNNEYDITGCHYGQEIPDGKGILVIHRMIIKNDKLWEGQTDFSYAKELLKKYNYKLIVSGDNHQHFVEEYKGKYLINAGSLMRTAKNQNTHKPCVYIYDLKDYSIEHIDIPIDLFEDVFDTNKIQHTAFLKEELEELVTAMQKGFKSSVDFFKNLEQLRKTADPETIQILDEIYMEDI